MPFFIKKILLLLLLFGAFQSVQAQVKVESDTTKEERINIDFSDVFEYILKEDTVIQRLVGNVELRQDSVFMYCDSATIIDNQRVIAQGNVIIQQGDSVNVFSDSLDYKGDLKIADLFGEVILESGDQKLFTQQLNYDLNTKKATYRSGATLLNGETQLTSKVGYYFVERDEAFFKDSVVVVDPNFKLWSDTLQFNTKTNIVTFLGPTLILSDSSRIYCEAGFYNTETNTARFTKNAEFVKGKQQAKAEVIQYNGDEGFYTLTGNARFKEGDQKASADVIRYDEKNDKTILTGNAKYQDKNQNIESAEIVYDGRSESYAAKGRSRVSDPPQILVADEISFNNAVGFGTASGDVIWKDTAANLTILCELADYNKETDYFKARGGRPLLMTVVDEDTLFMASDTLVSIRQDTSETDSTRLMLAYENVRIFKSNMQAICDSLVYNTSDSLFNFYKDPIIWSDTSQFFADTIDMEMRNGDVDKIYLTQNSFIINSPDEVFFNQIKGRDILASFKDGELSTMKVMGNAESVYYALDDEEAYIGVNKTVCSEMLIFFGNNEVEKIKFITSPQAELNPMGKVDHRAIRLEGFQWDQKERPKSKDDLRNPTPTFN